MKARRAAGTLLALALGAPGAGLAHPGMHDTIELLSSRIQAAPADPALYLERGIAYSEDGQHALALADFRRAEALGDPVRVAFDRGVVLYRKGDLEGARAAFTRTLVRFPDHALALDYRARAARDAGDAEAALADLERLFALRRDVSPGHFLSASELALNASGGGVDAALDVLDLGMERLGIVPQLQERAIELEGRRGAFAAALVRHDTLAVPLDRSPSWRVGRAELLLRLGRPAEAGEELARARSELAALRPTPARAALEARIGALSGAGRTAPQSEGS